MLTFPEIIVVPSQRAGRFNLFNGTHWRENVEFIDVRVAVKSAVKYRDRSLWAWFRSIPESQFREGPHRFDWYEPSLQPLLPEQE